MEAGKNYLVGVFEDPDVILNATKSVRKEGVKVHEVFSPHAIHGIDDALGYKMSRLPIVSFLLGFTGTTLALFTITWMLGYDWPMIIGGKNFVSLPPFIPVTFEFTVLLAAHGMVLTFFVVSDLKPWGKPKRFDMRCTDDKYIMAIDLGENHKNKNEISKLLSETGASEVNEKNFE
ncbi:MAG: DUF3341 domain-containing protein [Cyclobacteriaceae bacterium]|nr:DUF3341 domain-containing protein [Cyclobacteriaceae bacterium]